MFSLTFIFVFLPVTLGIYYIFPNRFKPYALTLISMCYYVCVDFKHLIYIITSVCIDYFLGIQINNKPRKSNWRRFLLALGVVKNLFTVLYFSAMKQITGVPPVFGAIVTSLLGMGYMIDVYKREHMAEYSIFRYLSFALFFPSLYYGPLVKYGDVKNQLIHIKPSLTGISNGIVMFISGIAKKIIIADTMVKLNRNLLAIPKYEFSVLTGWILMISFAFSLYFTLSAYFDVARGVGMMFSLKLPYGFYYPFQSRSLDEFFARFNITVNEYVRNYVYVQLGGKTNGTLSAMFNILLVSMLIGTWYGLRINCLAWGIYFGVLIIMEQYVYKRFWRGMPTFLQRFITFCATMMSFSIMQGENIGDTVFYWSVMFGVGTEQLYDNYTLYLLYSNFIILLLSFFMCTSLWNKLTKYCSKKIPLLWEFFSVLFNIATLICVCSFLL